MRFRDWCAISGQAPFPASPATVAKYVAEFSEAGIEKLTALVEEISRAHQEIGLADPTRSDVVTAALSDIAKIEPPRSWTGDNKALFPRLPYDLQKHVAEREAERERVIRRAMNEAADLRNELAALKKDAA